MDRSTVEIKSRLIKIQFNREYVKENIELYLIALPAIVLIFIFSYIPMYGVVIAFQNYAPGASFLSFSGDIDWVGFRHFQRFIEGPFFFRLMRNTVMLSLYNIVFGFPVPILFALLLNEIRALGFKKFTQTASYLPYFISAVVVAAMVLSFIQTDGIINNLTAFFGADRVAFITEPRYFPAIYTMTNIWKGFGFGSILYIAAIAGIDQELYESAHIDGANRLHMAWYITLPSIRPTIAIMLILAVGGIMGSNMELILLLYSSATYETADVIGTYIYRIGIQGGQFSFTAAIGLFATIINFILVFAANKLSGKLTGTSLF